MRRRKIFLRILRIISTLLISLLAIIALFFLLKSDFFKIDTISCFVNDTPCSGEVWTKLLSLSVGKNVLFLSPKTLTEEIQKNFPDVDGVMIKKTLPNKLNFELKAREAIAVIVQEAQPQFKAATESAQISTSSAEGKPVFLGKDFFIVDKTGVVFKKADSSFDLPIILISDIGEINLGQKVPTDPLVQSITLVTLLSKLDLKPEILKVSEGTVLAWLAGGPKAAFSLKKELPSQVGSLQLILSRAKIEGKTPEVIDLRFDKPVVKF